MHGKKENAYIVFVEKSKGKKSLGRYMRRWEDIVT
jgi:hypothetical protein